MSLSILAFVIALVGMCSPAAISKNDVDKKQTDVIKSLARQLILQQLAIEERIRSEGDSGIKQVRIGSGGTRPYHADTWVGRKVASIHDHANNIRTVGLGEFVAVLNGVEFRTRHNDYGLRMPSTKSKQWGAIEEIPFPEVPYAVKQQPTVKAQIAEMKEWFKAWKNQDYSKRDYRKHFKPVLCYLEGAWTLSGDKIEESFTSDRHFIDASTWFELQDKIRYMSYSGRKSGNENLAYLPTTLWDVSDEGVPSYAQWNYRILCQPLKDDIPLNRFRVVNDLGARMAFGSSMANHQNSRAARFQLNPNDKPWTDSEGSSQYGFMDRLMEQIPGKDNAGAKLTDNAMGDPAYHLKTDQPVNAAYYHRYFKSYKRGAMGLKTRSRGYADVNMWAAMTTQPKVAPMKYRDCPRRGKCTEISQRWTYAIPLEIIYLTPLYKWNPYNLKYKGVYSKKSKTIETVYAGGPKSNGGRRNGGLKPELAYNGTHSKLHIITPDEFYSGKELLKDPADTTRGGAYGVLDRKGNLRAVRAAGTRAMLPNIPGVGSLRTRYPIMPVHAEGSAIWKEIDALKDVVMDLSRYGHMLYKAPTFTSGQKINGTDDSLTYELPVTVRDPPGEHSHLLTLSPDDIKDLKAGKRVTVTTTIDNGHAHSLTLAYKKWKGYLVVLCDGSKKCWDGHGDVLKKADQ